jgi:type II secretory pathway component PulJ
VQPISANATLLDRQSTEIAALVGFGQSTGRHLGVPRLHWQDASATRNRRTPQRGFLLVELLIGLMIMALVMLGAAAIMEAVAQGWTDQDITRSTQLQANQTYIRVQNALMGAKYVGYPSSVSSGDSVFFWQNTNVHDLLSPSPYVSDPYAGEMALLQYDSATKTLWLYQVPASQASNPLAQVILAQSDIIQPAKATWFTQQPFVEKQALGGPGNGVDDGTRLDVEGFQASVSSLGALTQLPVVEYSISFARGDGTNLTLYNTTTLRGPTTQPQ